MDILIKTILFTGVLFFAAFDASAQSNELQLAPENVTLSAESSQENDIDDIITNRQLRAASGSKSLWSIGSSLEYNGGSLRQPLDEDRPNIAGTTATTDKALLDGQMEVKYNLANDHSLSAGIGLRWIAPLTGKRPRDYEGERFDLANPFLTYQFLYNLGGMQSVLQLQPVLYTESNLVQLGYAWSLLASQDSMIEIGSSRLSLGFSVWAQYGSFNKDEEDLRSEQADYILGLSPVLEYEFNEVFNFRTACNLWNFEHLRSQSAPHTYVHDRVTQSMGLGISVTRDMFIYPNVEFVPEELKAELTNIGVSADFSIF